MTDKDKLIQEMHKKARAITGKNSNKWTREAEDELWTMSSDWNREHEESEGIFMYEHENEETGYVDGFYIENDYYIVEA